MKYKSFVVMMAVILAVVLAAGCTSAPVKETSTSNVSATESQATSTSNVPATESQASDRYVEISLLDGTKVGGKYVSETAAFTTILVMYTMDPNAYTYYKSPGHLEHGSYTTGPIITVKDPNKYLVKGTGAEVSIKNSLINTMVTIEDPTPMIEATLQEMNANAVAMKKASEDIAEGYRMAAEARAAK
jgi:outer membrane murein-binding lipoprotein Lpp